MKRIVILNGNPKEENVGFDDYCERLKAHLEEKGDQVNLIKLRERKIGDCMGCYACWLKTPGVCALKDDHEAILKAYVHSDLILLASPMIMGFVSSELKKTTDRLIPLRHPYLRVNGDRMAHYPRYGQTARIGLLLEKSRSYEDSDLQLIYASYKHTAFTEFTDQDVEVVADEAHSL